MKRDISQETLESFLDQVREPLADMHSKWDTHVAESSSDAERLEDIRRNAHRLKGEASMIGLYDMSHVAAIVEELLEELATSDQDASQTTIGVCLNALTQYATDLLDPYREEQTPLVEAVITFRRFRNFPEAGDESALQQLIYAETSTDSVSGESNAHEDQDVPVSDHLLESFRVEATDHLQEIADILAQSDTPQLEDIAEIRRIVHSVKGGASTAGLQEAADLAHRVESLLESAVETEELAWQSCSELVIAGLDALGTLIEEGKSPDNLEQLNAQLAEFGQSGDAEPDFAQQSSGLRNDATADALREEIAQDLAVEVAPELLEVFVEEAEDHIKLIYHHLNALQTNPDDREHLQAVRRSAHTLKGAAGAVGMRMVTKLSHRMEDLLDQLFDNQKPATREILELLLNTTDQLNDLSFGQFDENQIVGLIHETYCEYTKHFAITSVTPSSQSAEATDSQPPTVEAYSLPEGTNEDGALVEQGESEQASPAGKRSVRPGERGQESRQMLRVPLERVDDLVRTVSELIINRTTFEQRMSDFVRGVDELGVVLDRIRSVSYDMETRFSVDALGRSAIVNEPVQSELRSKLGPTVQSEFDTLEFDRYNEFHILTRAISEIASDVNTVTNELGTLIGDFDSLLARQNRLSRETQDRLMRIRMVPLAVLATRLHRAVRVVASSQNKRVELVIEGEHTELDKTVLEEIADPLLHLIRNAVDHGVEPPDLRQVKGKPEQATIRIRAFHQGTQAVLRISDDGAGLNIQRIGEMAVRKGFLTQADLETMTPQEIFPFIFAQGLSTAQAVSEVSGRGVGMDIVRDKVQKLKGVITVDSEPDKGTTFTIRLPLTLAVTRALMVVAGNEMFAVPMQSVDQITRLPREDVEQLGENAVIRLNGTACPLIQLSTHLGLRETEDNAPTIPVLIIASGDTQVAVRVDKIIAGRDIVVKTLGSHLRKVRGLLGATLLGDGTVVPILDPNSLTGTESQLALPSSAAGAASGANRNTTVMIVDDSVSVRKVMENFVRSQGWTPLVAKDGVDALEVLQSVDFTPDIFLLDVEMPRMDGYELLATLRRHELYGSCPVVMVTSRSGEKHRNKAFALGANEYLVKPYQDDRLIEIVQKLALRQESSLA